MSSGPAAALQAERVDAVRVAEDQLVAVAHRHADRLGAGQTPGAPGDQRQEGVDVERRQHRARDLQ